ncbi:MAG: prenyltransferase/squalene oxidase repeat-containing protein [bacterium]|nr:prenyltransferase/squalene oxidase repeat-containing protein [bacterium]
MRFPLRIFLGIFAGLFLASAIGMSLVLADEIELLCPPVCPPDQVTFTIRDGGTIISSGSANLPAAGSPDVSITPTTGGAHDAPARSVLAILKNIESATTTFSVSDLQYSDAFSSFYLNCIAAPADPASPLCGNWQYVVNGTSPGVGMDAQTLSNDDVVYLYFGPSRQITPSTANVTIGVSFTVLAESYVASSDSWTPAVGLTMRILQGDPFGSPTTISSAATGADGRATFTINAAGSYTAGLAEDFYFPNSAITASDTPQPPVSAAGSTLARPEFDIPLAISYLAGHQRADGSFESTLLSDWAAIAFGGGGAGDAREKLRNVFISKPPVLESVTDYERHAMALESLGINPYSAGGVDYISHIVSAFDETQVGDPALVNDDIFALFPLMHAGYGADDEIIRKITSFIISKQSPDGSWSGSVDMTAAAIQALAPLKSLPDVGTALASATAYLHAEQRSKGGFGPAGKEDSFSTSWAVQAIYALDNGISNWTQNTFSPVDYLSSVQDRDGSVPKNESSVSTRLWATAYAIPAAERKTWHSLLSSFSRPVVEAETVQSATTSEILTEAVATSTTGVAAYAEPSLPPQPVAESTPPATREAPASAETTGDAPVLPESTSPPEAPAGRPGGDPPLAETPTGTQIAAAATVSTDPLEWLLALLLLILIAILIASILKHRSRNRNKSQSA